MSIKFLSICVLFALSACSSDSTADLAGSQSFTLEGNVALSRVSVSRALALNALVPVVTHVMAVNPESSNPQRFISEVASNGSFSIAVEANRPYILVFIDNNQVGINMIMGVFKANDLDTIAPIENTDGNIVSLGNVTADTGTAVATSDVAYLDLIEMLGLDVGSALALGAVDDLSLRYANPDIDGNGLIDALESDKEFGLDFHLRSIDKKGAVALRVNDMIDQFAEASGLNIFTPEFNLASIYALYKTTFENTSCVTMGGTLEVACGLSIAPGGGVPNAPASHSSLQFSEYNGFGPDYNMIGGDELPGSNGTPVNMDFDIGGHNLIFSNVVTRTRASLTGDGTIVPFLRFNTSGGKIVSISYKWMKMDTGTWVEATDLDIALLVNDEGGYASINISFTNSGTRDENVGFSIPTEANGTIAFTLENSSESTMDSTQMADVDADDICGMAVSYDDKLGLRIFSGAPQANVGVLACN